MVMVVSDVVIEQGLAVGELACRCGQVLAPWGFARARRVRRGLDGVVRPRRARCRGCGVTQVLLPPSVLVRRADSTETIGVALEAAAGGAGFRSLAARLGRAEGTVRGWLRRARANVAAFGVLAARWVRRLDPASSAAVVPAGSAIGELVEAVGQVMAAAVRRRGPGSGALSGWALACMLTGGLLLGRRLAGV